MQTPFILINIFTVSPEDQQHLISLLTKATEESIKYMDGFLSSTLHRSLDGTKVTMYAQWESKDAYDNMRKNTTASHYLDEALSLAKLEIGIYEIVDTFRKATR